ncbi:uncharacterized protein PHACADRAFT_202262 [Phanerochaete carnosa HHB-10118-sp]|uniref:Uncharacterized protein n=1 Tax=Phanerochaete carnosa (strain HHB-10118-sp) TaxID=650164 RepID=K5VQA0_PHACS|nr:uncharacterized protein PHACADRAFT_202262 [Phanerochaete carnosa HHB-10118-sp]EKM48900.1 hypothetical protein PHACADRAFT_202262 [Phanerochaete carnosa HHB-10118-sp]
MSTPAPLRTLPSPKSRKMDNPATRLAMAAAMTLVTRKVSFCPFADASRRCPNIVSVAPRVLQQLSCRTELQLDQILVSRCLSPNTAAKHQEMETSDKQLAPPCIAVTTSDTTHFRATSNASQCQSPQADIVRSPVLHLRCGHTPRTESQREKERALEIEKVKEDELDEEPQKRHAADENAFPSRSEHDDNERNHEGPRPKHSRRSPVRPSFCHSSCHVENLVIPPASASAAPVAAPASA